MSRSACGRSSLTRGPQAPESPARKSRPTRGPTLNQPGRESPAHSSEWQGQLPMFPAPGRALETKGLKMESHAHNIFRSSSRMEGTPGLVTKCVTAGPQGCLTSDLPLWSPTSKSRLQPTHTYIMWHGTKSQFKQLINFFEVKFKLKNIMALISL